VDGAQDLFSDAAAPGVEETSMPLSRENDQIGRQQFGFANNYVDLIAIGQAILPLVTRVMR